MRIQASPRSPTRRRESSGRADEGMQTAFSRSLCRGTRSTVTRALRDQRRARSGIAGLDAFSIRSPSVENLDLSVATGRKPEGTSTSALLAIVGVDLPLHPDVTSRDR